MKKQTKQVKRLPIMFPINLTPQFAETASGEAPTEIQVLPTGKWNHPAYGPIVITSEDISEFKANFDKGLRKGIPITEGHDNGFGGGELPAVGWFTDLIDRGANGLYAVVEWTKKGKTLLGEKAYKYFSPEFYSEYEDPETREIHTNVLVGGALTNKPYFKELEAVVLSEKSISNQFNFNDDNTMNLQELLAKKPEDLTPEEAAFVREHKDELTEEQTETFKSVLEDAGEGEGEGNGEGEGEGNGEGEGAGEGEGEGGEGEGEGEGGEGGEGAGEGEGEGEGEGQAPAQASEGVTIKNGMVQMSQAAYKALENKANKGYEASEQLRLSNIQNEANALVLSEQNSKGRFLPQHGEKVFSFMKELDAKQRKAFAELVNAIPSSKLFNESGHGGNTEGTAFNEIDAKAEKLMSENKGMSYADAVKKVCSDNPELNNRYQAELKK